MSKALSQIPSKRPTRSEPKNLAGAPPRKQRRLAALPSFASTEEVESPDAEAEFPEPCTPSSRGGAESLVEPTPSSRGGGGAACSQQSLQDVNPTPSSRGGGGAACSQRSLQVAEGFSWACAELAAASEREGLEVMFMMFGTEETSQPFCLKYHLSHNDYRQESIPGE